MKKALAATAAIALLTGITIAAAPAASAGSGYTLGGWVEVGGPDDFTYRMPNPEANFDKTCARGANGWAPWMRVGAKFPVYNGTGGRVGSVTITKAEWVEDYGLEGNCYYYMSGSGLRRANFYCMAAPNDHVWHIASGSEAKGRVVPAELWLINDEFETPYADRECGGTW
jgi:hypothetical protein